MNFINNFSSNPTALKNVLIWNVLFCLGLGIQLILYNLYLEEILNSQLEIGKIISLKFLAEAIFYLPAGYLADKVGARKGLLIGLFILITGLIGNIFASTTALILFFGIIIGIGQSFTIVMFVPLLTEVTLREERTKIFSIAFGSGTFFTFLGTIAGGYISDFVSNFFHQSNLNSLRVALIIAIISILMSICPLYLLKVKRTPSSRRSFSQFIKENSQVLKGSIAHYTIIKCLIGMSIGLVIPFANLFLSNRFSMTNSTIGLVIGLGSLATVFFISMHPKLSKSIEDTKLITIYFVISVPILLIMGFSNHVFLSALCFLLYRSFQFSVNPVMSKVMMERVDDSLKGLTNSVGFMATTIGTSLVGSASMYVVSLHGNYWGYIYLYSLSGALTIVSAFYFYKVFRPAKAISIGNEAINL